MFARHRPRGGERALTQRWIRREAQELVGGRLARGAGAVAQRHDQREVLVCDDRTRRLGRRLTRSCRARAPEQLFLPDEQPNEYDGSDREREDDEDVRLTALIRPEDHGVHSTRRAATVSISSAGSAGSTSGSA